jgi:peptide/nickel transport system substrate-binding protein
MRRLWIAISLLVALAMLASCAPAATPAPVETEAPPSGTPTMVPEPEPTSPPPEPEVPQILNINSRIGPEVLDIQVDQWSAGQRILGNIHDRLVAIDADSHVVPELAKDWDISEDGLTYTFYLEQGATFHDGTPVNPEAVKFTFDRILKPETGSMYSSEYTMIDSVDVIDDSTVEFTLKHPYAPFLRQMAMTTAGILSPTAVEKWGEDYSSHPVGAGPFKLEEWVPGERLVLVRNEDYWRESPKLERINFSFISEEQARVSALLAGDTDFDTVIPPSLISMVEADPDMVIERGPSAFLEWVDFNVEKPIVDDVLVRKAISCAIDVDAIIEGIFMGAATRSTQCVAPSVYGYDDTIQPIPYEPDMARDLLAQAGWQDTDGDGVVDKDGQKFTVEFRIMNEPGIVQEAQAIQGYMADVGMEANIVVEEYGAYWADVLAGNTQMFINGYDTPLGDADPVLSTLFSTEQVGLGNASRYSNPEMDRLIEEQRAEADPELRLALLKQAINLVVDDAIQVPVLVRENVMGHHRKVKGFVLEAPSTFLNLDTVYIEE